VDSGGCRKDLYDNLLTHLGQCAHASRAICLRISGNLLTHLGQFVFASRAICSRIPRPHTSYSAPPLMEETVDSGGCRKDLYDNLLTHLGQFPHASRAICSRISGNLLAHLDNSLTHPSTPHHSRSAAVNGGDCGFRRATLNPQPCRGLQGYFAYTKPPLRRTLQ
jgi:hypothetical protein